MRSLTLFLCLSSWALAQTNPDSLNDSTQTISTETAAETATSLRAHTHAFGLHAGFLSASGPTFRHWGQQWGVQMTLGPYVRSHKGFLDYNVQSSLILLRNFWDSKVKKTRWGTFSSNTYGYFGLMGHLEQYQNRYDQQVSNPPSNNSQRIGGGAGLGIDLQWQPVRLGFGTGMIYTDYRANTNGVPESPKAGTQFTLDALIQIFW